MSVVRLTTEIRAPIETCFDLSRDVGIHQLTIQGTGEKAIAGRINGLCELNDEITLRAKHFGLAQHLTVKIIELNRPYFFAGVML